MSSMTNESGGRKMANGHKDSPPVDESCSDKRGGTLKKGPWTPAEDAILMDYVNKHGEGNWNAVQKHSGLSRCGKSCRLRWANHLRPDLKKGAFSPEEESLIIEPHAKIGNKWARMAAELPGRTDNEIKNFWNTRTFMPQLLDILASSILRPGVSSSQNVTFMLPTMFPPKRPREAETLLPYVDDSSICNAYLFRSSSPLDPDFIYSHQFPFDGALGSHTLLNGNCSSESASEAMMKLELPSLQYSETQQGSRDLPASPLPSLESVDTLIQSPPTKESTQPDYLLPRSTGLLETVLYESQALKRPKKSSGQQTSDNVAMPSDAVHSFSAEGKEWERYGDPNSHSSYSVASEFSEHTPINQCSSGESQMAETMPGYDVKHEACRVSAQNVDEKELPKMDFSRLDVLLDSSWLHGSKHSKDQWILSDAIDALLCEDYISDHP